MKNHRDVCAAQDAGYVEYAGLPGEVKTGCMETPEQRSKFCFQHKPRQAHPDSSSDNEEELRGKVVEMILSKKTTRTNTLHEVIHLFMHMHL